MHIISRKALTDFSQKHSIARIPLDDWFRTAKSAKWRHLEEVKQIYADAEAVGNFTIFNIGTNKYRLVVGLDYEAQIIYIKYVLTHAEYDKEKWKNDSYY